MPAVIGTATSSDWSSAGALLTFFFPVVLFIVVAAVLYVEFNRPHAVPGLTVNPAPAAQAQAAEPHVPQAGHEDDAEGAGQSG